MLQVIQYMLTCFYGDMPKSMTAGGRGWGRHVKNMILNEGQIARWTSHTRGGRLISYIKVKLVIFEILV
jgi:hypothetical protein